MKLSEEDDKKLLRIKIKLLGVPIEFCSKLLLQDYGTLESRLKFNTWFRTIKYRLTEQEIVFLTRISIELN